MTLDPDQILCARCGETGASRAVLTECHYALEEIRVPFQPVAVFIPNHGFQDIVPLRRAAATLVDAAGIPTSAPNIDEILASPVICRGPLQGRKAYVVEVCLRCRAEYMAMMETWWNGKTQPFAYERAVEMAREKVRRNASAPAEERVELDPRQVPVRVLGASVIVDTTHEKVRPGGPTRFIRGRRQKPSKTKRRRLRR